MHSSPERTSPSRVAEKHQDDDGLWDAPLVVAATPIGNLGDVTMRLVALMGSADVIACEDTRRTRHLLQALGVQTSARLVSMHEHNEASRAAELISQAQNGQRILVVSDAGMPAVSDPGFRLVSSAVAAGVGITVAPGASAVTTALALSGLATDAFTFAGFIPRKHTDRQHLIQRLQQETWTTVVFESPHRIAATVSELAEHLGPHRQAAAARELTKKFEEVLRGTLAELAETLTHRHHQGGNRGEFVLVLAGAHPRADTGEEPVSLDELAVQVLDRVAQGERMKSAAKELAAAHGLSARDLYDAALALRSAQ